MTRGEWTDKADVGLRDLVCTAFIQRFSAVVDQMAQFLKLGGLHTVDSLPRRLSVAG